MWLSSSATKIVLLLLIVTLPNVIVVSGYLLVVSRVQLSTNHEQLTSFREIQLKPKRAAFAHRALDENPSAMDCFDNVLHQRQPKPRAFGHSVVGFGPVELIEHKRQVLRRNAHTCVTNSGDHL